MNKILSFATLFFLLMASPGRGQVPSIVIDPAHGGKDYGVMVTEKITEKDVTLKISLLVKKELEKTGRVKVILTREKDTDLSIKDRIKLIQEIKPTAIVSLHVNRGFGRSARGFEIYFPGFKVDEDGKVKGGEAQSIINSMRKTEYLNKSVTMAQHLQRHLIYVFPKENRGLREASMEMTDSVTIPAVVVEIGFASNPENMRKLTDTKGQMEVASALSRGILEWIGKK
ncbi:MAG: N-acetylmuramoyl-L-alanine amidase [Syntrophales bacterium]|nr:N-acetylmuramoyl-L-alanine amidase [Syntrophales bacterium]